MLKKYQKRLKYYEKRLLIKSLKSLYNKYIFIKQLLKFVLLSTIKYNKIKFNMI